MKRGDLGARVAHLREGRGWSRAELARRLKVDPSYVSHIEQGERLPSLGLMSRLASTFSMPLADFFSDVPVSEKPPHPELASFGRDAAVELMSHTLEVTSKGWSEQDWRRFEDALRLMRNSHSEGKHSRWGRSIRKTSSGRST
jgi:transcriptional regulator with XRE-family HTH domain